MFCEDNPPLPAFIYYVSQMIL